MSTRVPLAPPVQTRTAFAAIPSPTTASRLHPSAQGWSPQRATLGNRTRHALFTPEALRTPAATRRHPVAGWRQPPDKLPAIKPKAPKGRHQLQLGNCQFALCRLHAGGCLRSWRLNRCHYVELPIRNKRLCGVGMLCNPSTAFFNPPGAIAGLQCFPRISLRKECNNPAFTAAHSRQTYRARPKIIVEIRGPFCYARTCILLESSLTTWKKPSAVSD